MIAYDEALARLLAGVGTTATEDLALERAADRVLASAVIAARTSPATDQSAMDGYAVWQGDLHLSQRLAVQGVAYPGTPFLGQVADDACLRVFTGAPLPPGAERVVVQENVERDGDVAILRNLPSDQRFIRRKGADFVAGARLLDVGQRMHPRALLVAAAADVATLSVYGRPRVALLATGDELAEPGDPERSALAIPDSLSSALPPCIERWGGALVVRTRAGDAVEALRQAATASLEAADIVVVTGGASVGEKDYARAVFDALGVAPTFARVAMMPGKPVWSGRLGEKIVLGLPGNPASAMVTARLFLAPLLARLAGADPADVLRWEQRPLLNDLPTAGDRETFVRAVREPAGVRAIPVQDSGMQHALLAADVLIRRAPAAPSVSAGATVEVLDF
jgi:molybdopterin molybdotransferase